MTEFDDIINARLREQAAKIAKQQAEASREQQKVKQAEQARQQKLDKVTAAVDLIQSFGAFAAARALAKNVPMDAVLWRRFKQIPFGWIAGNFNIPGISVFSESISATGNYDIPPTPQAVVLLPQGAVSVIGEGTGIRRAVPAPIGAEHLQYLSQQEFEPHPGVSELSGRVREITGCIADFMIRNGLYAPQEEASQPQWVIL